MHVHVNLNVHVNVNGRMGDVHLRSSVVLMRDRMRVR